MGLFGFMGSNDSPGEASADGGEGGDRDRRETRPPSDFSVTFNPQSSEGEMDREKLIRNADGTEAYAGRWPRRMYENKKENPTEPTWIGYHTDPQMGLREVPIDHKSWFRHAAVFGTTGYGKTTFLKNLMVQWAYAGWGFCFIDPKGDGVFDVVRELPEHRLDDLVWVDPAAPEEDEQIVGLNFLRASIERDDERAFDKEVEAVVDDMRSIIRNENYWGSRMDGIFNTICRAMVQSEKPYTLVDMYYVLLDEEYREYFVEDIDDDAVRRYARVIADDMDQEDLDPLLRRIKKLVESRITREVIAHRDTSIDVRKCVEEGKIILVKNNLSDDDVRRMIATGVMRRIWAAAQARAAAPKSERTPYFLLVDEFDDVVSEDSDIERMLSKARSMRLSLTLCCQQPSQLPESTRKGIFGNCDNLLAMNPSEPGDARLIMERFGQHTADELTDLGRFKMFTRISLGAEQSDPFVTNTFADYPPLRTPAEAREVIDHSLDRHGTDRLDPDKIFGDTIIGRSEYDMDRASVFGDGDGDVAESGEDGGISEREVLEGIYAVATHRRNTARDGSVSIDRGDAGGTSTEQSAD